MQGDVLATPMLTHICQVSRACSSRHTLPAATGEG